MKEMLIMTLARLSLLLLLQQSKATGSEYDCGFPGTPAFGFVNPDEDAYEEGDVVTYSCRVGYILLGNPIRRCKEDGTWTGDVPICDDSMTTLGTAFSTAAVPGHPPQLAIDRDKDTCAYLSPKNPRWWRIHLGGIHKVLSVAVTMASPEKYVKFTVFVIKLDGPNALYKRCASFTGKFGTSTILLICAEGKGIEGEQVHIEDHMKTDGLFDICEVEVQVEKAEKGYKCGRPERKLNSVTFDPENNKVEYTCKTGYELKGKRKRRCLDTGQWDGEAPVCEAIICESLPPLENGQMKLRLINGDSPLEGTIANFKCNEGYRLIGDFSRICLKDGSWSGKEPHCEAVRCGVPDGKELGGIYRLVNKTTRMGSMAILKCRKGKMEGDDPYIICSEEGEWTESHARCLIPAKSMVGSSDGPRIVNKGAIIFGMVVAAVMVAIVLVSLYVVMQRRRNANKPELPARQIETPEAPPRPPPRDKMPFTSALMDYMSRDSKPTKPEPDVERNESSWKTRSLPLKSDDSRYSQPEPSPNKATSLDQALYTKVADEKDADKSKTEPEDTHEGTSSEPIIDENANEEPEAETAEDKEAEEEEDTISAPPVKDTPGRDYAAVDYEKKRESRLMKEQKSEEEEEEEEEESEEEEEEEESNSPEVPPKSADLVDTKDSTEPIKKSNAEDKKSPALEPQKEKPVEDDEAASSRKRTRAPVEVPAEEPEVPAEDKTSQPRRMRWRAEPPAEEEPRSTRGLRRTRDWDK